MLCYSSLQGGPLRFGWVLQQPAVPKVVSKRTVVACTATRTSSSSTTDSGSSGSNTDINRIAGDWGELAASLSQQPSSVRRTGRSAVPPPQEVGPKRTVSSPARQRRIRSSDTDLESQADGPARGPPRQHATPARTSFPASNMQQPQHQLQRNGAKAQASITARNKSSKNVKKVAALSASKHPCCYGCGAPLQIEVPLGPGYVPADKYEMKKKHKQLNKVCCLDVAAGSAKLTASSALLALTCDALALHAIQWCCLLVVLHKGFQRSTNVVSPSAGRCVQLMSRKPTICWSTGMHVCLCRCYVLDVVSCAMVL